MINGLIDRLFNFPIRDIFSLLRSPIQESLQFPGDCCAVLGGWEMLTGDGDNTDFLVGVNRPAQKLLDGGLHAWREFAGLLSRDILHGWLFDGTNFGHFPDAY
jgi:hypothetical protein